MNGVPISSSGIREPVIYTAPNILSVHKYMPVAVLYFFLNSAGLPQGLFYTTLLSPLFFLWLFSEGERWLTLRFLLCLSPFVIAHAINGIDSPVYYARSSFLLWTVYVTVYALCYALLNNQKLERLFEQLIVLNFCAAIMGVIALFTPLREVFWYDDSIVNGGVSSGMRLRLLASEPSVYANLMAPLLVFVVLRLLQRPGKRNLQYVILISVPFLLCQSFGGISMCVAGIAVAVLVTFRHLLKQRGAFLILIMVVIAVGLLLIVPNPISQRLILVATGSDSSTHSRTNFAFIVAYMVASSKSLWWGAGLGQGKLADVSNLGLGFTVGTIPNAVASTFAELGIVGVLVRLAAEFYLFFKTRVYVNPFRLAMFVVAFIAQLTGSHLMDVQEYLMWCFAFAPFFPAMNTKDSAQSRIIRA